VVAAAVKLLLVPISAERVAAVHHSFKNLQLFLERPTQLRSEQVVLAGRAAATTTEQREIRANLAHFSMLEAGKSVTQPHLQSPA
jgi:hypothetical protein